MVVENGAYAVTGAMKAFPNQHALQMHGIRIIGAIGCFGTFECLQALLAAKGDVCLVEAMRAHPKQAAVQEAGCGALAGGERLVAEQVGDLADERRPGSAAIAGGAWHGSLKAWRPSSLRVACLTTGLDRRVEPKAED